MSYTFGAGTGDDVTASNVASLTFGASARVQLVCGWWRPTTLTATRGLWSAGNVFGAEIDATTSELRLRTDNTTDGQWTTTGVGLAVDEWKFLAFMANCDNTAGAQWRVWAGTVDTPPAEVTVAVAVARSGNFTGNTSLYIGNKGTGTLAFQGQAAAVSFLACLSGAATATSFGLQAATAGVITQNEADLALQRWVHPLWGGRVPAQIQHASAADPFECHHWSGTLGAVWHRRQSTTSATSAIPTVNGATLSLIDPPCTPPPNWPHLQPFVPRRRQ